MRVAQRDLKPSAYAAWLLAHVQGSEPALRAWASLDPAHAVAAAARADLAHPTAQGPLHGMPIGVKDIIATADLPTQYGSPAFARPSRAARCGGDRAPGRCGRLRVRQDRDHGIRLHAARGDAQSVERGAHPGRLVVGLGGSGRGASRAGGDRHPDQRLGHPPGGVLRCRRLQADARRDTARRHVRVQRHARHAGHVHAWRRRCRTFRQRNCITRANRTRRRRARAPAAHRVARRLSMDRDRRRSRRDAGRDGDAAAPRRRRNRARGAAGCARTPPSTCIAR